MILRNGLMMNHGAHLAKTQSRLSGLIWPWTLAEQRISQMEWPWKSAKTDSSSSKNWHTYSIFRVQYRGTNHSILPITSTKIQPLEQGLQSICNSEHQWNFKIANGNTFENWSNGFVISSNLEHIKSLAPRIWCKRNFFIWVNWSKVMACQTGLPEIMNNMQIYNKGNWPTLRGSKPSQKDSEWPETGNIGSLIRILNFLKVASHETQLNQRYSNTNMPSCRYLTHEQKMQNWHNSKWDFTEWFEMSI